MIRLGAICQNIMFRDEATAVLTEHATYTWNNAGTRIRCNGGSCGIILDAPDGPDGITAAPAFAIHQAEQLPDPFDPHTEAPAAPAEPAEPQAIETTAVPSAEPVALESADPIEDPEPTPEPEPAGEPMETAVEPAAKVRRDTKALTATIAEINKGDRVAAGFNHPRYGQFTVMGTVLKGGAGLDRNQLMVGGWYINLNERAAKYLQELVIVATAGNHEFDIPKPSDLTEHVGIGS